MTATRRTTLGLLAFLACVAGVARAADVVVGSGPKDKISLQISTKSTNPASRSIKLSIKDDDLVFTAGGGITDDAVTGGAVVAVFSATDCQCIHMDIAPSSNPGWTATPAAAPKSYKWKDTATRSSGQVKGGRFKLKRAGGITYGLDTTPQGEVEAQVRFGAATDTVCARFAAPDNAAKNDSATKYASKAFATGTVACSSLPIVCGVCFPLSTTSSTTTSTTSTTTTTTTLPSCGVYTTQWGTYGTADGEFTVPYDVVINSVGEVIVADTYNHRIQKFDTSGNFIAKWGSEGAADGQFEFPIGLALDASDNVWVADSNHHRIQKFDSSGMFLAKFGGIEGSGDGEFEYVEDVVVDPAGNFYVVDYYNGRIQKFDSSGAFLTKWGSVGSGDGQFNNPADIVMDETGNLYVADVGNHRVQKFDSAGNLLAKWDLSTIGDGSFEFTPFGLTVDSGHVFVTDAGSYSRVVVFAEDGTYLTQWGSEGTGDGQMHSPRGVAVDTDGNVYVVDYHPNDRVEKFSCALP
jgi:DNA-binding beta-propeller fold protein YncE